MITAIIALTVFWCEFAVFYFTLWTSCDWPQIGGKAGDEYIRAMLLSDTHLLGRRKGHWFDKLRREWQMYVSFLAATHLFVPESVFFLGDILDEGQIASKEEFEVYTKRYEQIFASSAKRVVVAGNHDVGFHDRLLFFDPYLRVRFEKAFNSSLVEMFEIKGVKFVVVNSMALEGDDCHLCYEAFDEINRLGKKLSSDCQNFATCRPVLLMHFPLYRESDEICNEIDSDFSAARTAKFKPKIDCVSRESTDFILKKLKPRVVFTGHTHHGCLVRHTEAAIEEWTLASFSWRNKRSPSFLLAIISANDYKIAKCVLPNEVTVIGTYVCALISLIVYLVKVCK
ncbi:hypothetical protein B4U79_01001 [Dinothrombium tinctorium]|uniref:Calcineurin-like phosphoesterase domain-containing protein n=1 Tax=Dinothrombium tinctorium TaxID=1965070 RepID=A0A3S3P6I8_9ACAR|nr:hypothetical protein B4U79_01001 [Dinothrombium tinctorium]